MISMYFFRTRHYSKQSQTQVLARREPIRIQIAIKNHKLKAKYNYSAAAVIGMKCGFFRACCALSLHLATRLPSVWPV